MNMFELDLTLFAMLFGVAACIGLVVLQRRLAEQTAQAAQLQQQMALLNNISYLPSLLPVIMQNREALELSDRRLGYKQIKTVV